MPAEHPLVAVTTPHVPPEQVDRSRWPIHVTVAGNFEVDDAAVETLPPIMRAAAADVSLFEVRLGSPDRFGAGGSVPVLLVSHPSLDELHASLAARLSEVAGFTPLEPAYWGDGYRSHATLGRAVTAREGERLTLRYLSLFSLMPATARRLACILLDGAGPLA
jgi:2'-5' RNA ligase